MVETIKKVWVLVLLITIISVGVLVHAILTGNGKGLVIGIGFLTLMILSIFMGSPKE